MRDEEKEIYIERNPGHMVIHSGIQSHTQIYTKPCAHVSADSDKVGSTAPYMLTSESWRHWGQRMGRPRCPLSCSLREDTTSAKLGTGVSCSPSMGHRGLGKAGILGLGSFLGGLPTSGREGSDGATQRGQSWARTTFCQLPSPSWKLSSPLVASTLAYEHGVKNHWAWAFPLSSHLVLAQADL